MTPAGPCHAGSDAMADENQGVVTGWVAGQSTGCPGGFWGDGSCDASAEECDEGDVSVGVRGRRHAEGDGGYVGRGGVCLVIKK